MKFSIIVANYNNGRYLTSLIESVKAQTYSNWELIIVDDCSTDDSLKLIKGGLNEKIKLLIHSENKGASAAFKAGIDFSSGDLIGLMGADDALDREAIQSIKNAFVAHPHASLVYTSHYICTERMERIAITKSVMALAGPYDLIRKRVIVSSFAVFPRD